MSRKVIVLDTPEARMMDMLRKSMDEKFESLFMGTSAKPEPQDPLTWDKLKDAVEKIGEPVEREILPWPMKIKMEPEIKPQKIPFLVYGAPMVMQPITNSRIPYSRHRSKRIWKKLRKRYGRQDMPFGIILNSVTA